MKERDRCLLFYYHRLVKWFLHRATLFLRFFAVDNSIKWAEICCIFIDRNDHMFKRHRLTIKIFFLPIFFLQLLFHSFAQLNPANLTQFTEQDGVPGSQVNHVLQDKFGYIWVSTINGLARYDGYDFKRFFNNPNDSNSIKGLDCWKIFEDRKGRIWASDSRIISKLLLAKPKHRSHK